MEFSIGQKRESEREFNARARTREKELTQNRASRANNMRLHVGWKEFVENRFFLPPADGRPDILCVCVCIIEIGKIMKN